jgi:hypothetical protein
MNVKSATAADWIYHVVLFICGLIGIGLYQSEHEARIKAEQALAAVQAAYNEISNKNFQGYHYHCTVGEVQVCAQADTWRVFGKSPVTGYDFVRGDRKQLQSDINKTKKRISDIDKQLGDKP